MSWAKLTGEEPSVTLHKTNGKVTWNWAAHVLMGKPSSVELLYDQANHRLGFRGASDGNCLRIVEEDDFSIEAKAQLDSAGLTPTENYTATLQVYLNPDPLDPAPLLPGGAWIELPGA